MSSRVVPLNTSRIDRIFDKNGPILSRQERPASSTTGSQPLILNEQIVYCVKIELTSGLWTELTPLGLRIAHGSHVLR